MPTLRLLAVRHASNGLWFLQQLHAILSQKRHWVQGSPVYMYSEGMERYGPFSRFEMLLRVVFKNYFTPGTAGSIRDSGLVFGHARGATQSRYKATDPKAIRAIPHAPQQSSFSTVTRPPKNRVRRLFVFMCACALENVNVKCSLAIPLRHES